MTNLKLFSFAFLAVALLAGCICTDYLFGQQTNLVPSKANFVAYIKIAEVVNDPDVLQLTGMTQQEFEKQLLQAQAERGIDARLIRQAVIFGDTERPQYLGSIFYGQIDSSAYIAKAKARGAQEQDYNGFQVYKDGSTYFAFVDGALASGSLEAVKDVIDVKKGALKPLNDPLINEASAKVDKNAWIYAASRVTPQMQSQVSSQTGPVQLKGTESIQAAALSIDKKSSAVDIKLALLANDSVSANRASNSVTGVLALLKSISAPNSAGEKFLNQIQVSTQDKAVMITLATTVADLQAFSAEMRG